jgi:hypothetical protein
MRTPIGLIIDLARPKNHLKPREGDNTSIKFGSFIRASNNRKWLKHFARDYSFLS